MTKMELKTTKLWWESKKNNRDITHMLIVHSGTDFHDFPDWAQGKSDLREKCERYHESRHELLEIYTYDKKFEEQNGGYSVSEFTR